MNCRISEFAAYLRSQEKAAATVAKYVRDVRAFQNHCGAELTKEAVIAYKTYLLDRYAVRSVNSVIASLNAYFSFILLRLLHRARWQCAKS